MDAGTGLLVKMGVAYLVFCLTFFFATRRNPKVVVEKKWAIPLIALVYTVLSLSIVYWFLLKFLTVATFGYFGVTLPFFINLILVFCLLELFDKRKWLRVDSLFATLWLALLLTLAHTAVILGLALFSK